MYNSLIIGYEALNCFRMKKRFETCFKIFKRALLTVAGDHNLVCESSRNVVQTLRQTIEEKRVKQNCLVAHRKAYQALSNQDLISKLTLQPGLNRVFSETLLICYIYYAQPREKSAGTYMNHVRL